MPHTPNSELRPPLKRRPLWRDLGEIALLVVIIYTFVNLTTRAPWLRAAVCALTSRRVSW